MRLIVLIVALIIAAIIAATQLTTDFRKIEHENYLVRCNHLSGEFVSHVVKAGNITFRESGTTGTSVKGYAFRYPAETTCTRHPITTDQLKEYLPGSQ